MRISVFGLGYVGAVCSACFARQGHTVIGVDVSPYKVDLVNAGSSPIIEVGLPQLIADAIGAGRLSATTSAREAIQNSDLSFICVGTPSLRNGGLNLNHVVNVCHDIGAALKEKDDYHFVVMRSTVLPGTVRQVVIPALEEASGKTAGKDFGVAMNPEFLRESTAIADFYDPPKTVIGEFDAGTAECVTGLYEFTDAPLICVPLEAAEMVKYADNAWHATKVAFANEIGNICKEVGVDGHQVMDVFCQDRKLNISAAYLKPGFAFGGSCLPKDVKALTYKARSLDLESPLLSSLMSSNGKQVDRAFEMIQLQPGRKVGLLGLSFKAGTDDLRESPMVELSERLIGKGYDLKIFDRNVAMARISGANRDYLMHRIPHVSQLLSTDLQQVVSESDTLVVGNRDSEFSDVLGQVREDQVLIDLVRVSPQSSSDRYRGICW